MWNEQAGARVSQLRTERNLTRTEFGELISKSEQYIGRIERGTLAISGEIAAKISDATGVSTDYILRGTVDPLATVAALHGLSREQIQITLDIAAEIIKFVSTDDGNNVLLQEVLRRSRQRINDQLP
jgi:transcriptional regulator with XRE-family HTH domain